MNLQTAQDLVSNIDTATRVFEDSLRPTLQNYLDFLPELGVSWGPTKYTQAVDYSFREVENTNFIFASEEFYEYGEYTSDIIELPFAFVENPEKYRADLLERMRAAEAMRTEKQRKQAEERILKLREQLEREERRLNNV